MRAEKAGLWHLKSPRILKTVHAVLPRTTGAMSAMSNTTGMNVRIIGFYFSVLRPQIQNLYIYGYE